jgi:predicted component of type VI protein secretion system
MFEEIKEKIAKTNEQRVKMALTIMNVMKHSHSASIEMRSAVAASMIDMLNTDMIEEDTDLIKFINEGIDNVCEDAKKYGVNDLRSQLERSITVAKQMVNEKMDRINEGDNILNKINFNLN